MNTLSILLLLSFVSGPNGDGGAKSSVEAHVRGLVSRALIAEIRGDVEAYTQNWHVDGVQYFAGQAPIRGRSAIAGSVQEFITNYELTTDTSPKDLCLDATVVGDMAIVNCDVRFSIRKRNTSEGDSESVLEYAHIVYILVREEGNWWFWQENTMSAPVE